MKRAVVAMLLAGAMAAGCCGLAGCAGGNVPAPQPAPSDGAPASQPAPSDGAPAARPAPAGDASANDSSANDGPADGASADGAPSASEPAAASGIPASENHGSLGMFEAKTIDGGTFTQVDLARADVTVFNFWSTSCGPCVNEMDDLAALADRLPANVQIVNMCLDGAYNTERARAILADAGFDGVTLVGATNGLLDLCYSVQYTPTRVLVTGDGTVVGDPLIGAVPNFEDVMLDAANTVLGWLGKEAVALAAA